MSLQGDRPDDAVIFLKLLYHQAKGDKSPAELLTSASQAVGAARFSHKYAATMQLKTCDQYLYDHVGDEQTADLGKTWGPLQWIDFAEQCNLSRTVAAWEHWALQNFDTLKQDILGPDNTISSRSLSRICRGLHETMMACAYCTANRGPQQDSRCCASCGNCKADCGPQYDPSYCGVCGRCRHCGTYCSQMPDGKYGCPTHGISGGQSKPSARQTPVTVETLMSWQ